MSEYRLGLYEKAMPNDCSLIEKLEIAKRCGYDFVEMSIDETEEKISRLDMSRAERKRLCECSLDLGISFESICLSAHRKYPLGSEQQAVRERAMEIMEKAIRLAAEIGVRLIQIAGYDVYYEDSNEHTRAWFEENLRKSVAFAAMYGVVLAFETMETDFLNTVEKAMYWVNKISSPYLCIYPDSGNITNAARLYHTSEYRDLQIGFGHLAAIHLKESLPGKYREISYGSGHVDFKDLIQESYQLGVRRYLAEFWYLGERDYEQELKKANHFLRSCFPC